MITYIRWNDTQLSSIIDNACRIMEDSVSNLWVKLLEAIATDAYMLIHKWN